MPPLKTRQACLRKIDEIMGGAAVSADVARPESRLTLADVWSDVLDQLKDEAAPLPRPDAAPQPTVQEMTSATSAA